MACKAVAALFDKNAAAEKVMETKRTAAEDPAIASDATRLMHAHAELEEAQSEVDELYARWAELEKKQQA